MMYSARNVLIKTINLRCCFITYFRQYLTMDLSSAFVKSPIPFTMSIASLDNFFLYVSARKNNKIG